MGVPELWEVSEILTCIEILSFQRRACIARQILNHAGKSRAIAHLAVVDGFEKNDSGCRAFRVGVDASIWLQHATFSAGRPEDRDKRGHNPELRLLFNRLCKLSRLPLSLLFMFDGKERPKVKRGSRMGKSGSHNLAKGFKKLLDIFGVDWREAKGEAEAELAYLNQIGSLDAIISDDVDALVFGARVVIKNMSLNLTGNKSHPATDANGKPSAAHVSIYTSDDLATHPEVQLTRGGLVLFALMSGGDYDKGVPRCGKQIAHALARLGYGDRLLEAYEARNIRNFDAFLLEWRAEMENEVHTNAHKLMTRMSPSFKIPSTFPDMTVFRLYLEPATNAALGIADHPPRDAHSIDLPALAKFCEDHFDEWGHRSALLKKFKSMLTSGLVMTVLRAAAAQADKREEERQIAAGTRPRDVRIQGVLTPPAGRGVGTSATLVKSCLVPKKRATRDERMERIAAVFVNRGSPEPERVEEVEEVEDRHPLLVGITRTREHVSTDKLLEYRVEVCPRQFAELASSGIRGKHPEPAGAGAGRQGADSDDEMGDDEEDADGGQGRGKKKANGPYDNVLLWIPASIMRQVHPELVEEYDEKQREKQAKKSPKKR
ncbi:hypothetical protein C8Q76DRAFT_632692, partial [Earliella scabrosa]